MTIDWSIITDWVQAIGSVAAVWAAFAIFSRQNREHNAREQNAAEAKITAARAVLKRSHEAIRRAHSKMTRSAKTTFALGNVSATEEDLDECIDLLCSVPLFELPSTDLVTRVMDARYWLNTARRRTEKVREALEAGASMDKDLYKDPLNHLTQAADF
ncbi:hypothetical protein [Brevundimonas sp. G8]|uniref:hypothetical protein n=1 Tax=Brevundimonas sp. G8 TaxID=1350776 RepID=UPI0012F06843|nr:hypothetical protein [Brevundimonas sp. G8]VXB03169.1 hypothetical protein BREVUG8_100192 [Brevundimonas sp. G8]